MCGLTPVQSSRVARFMATKLDILFFNAGGVVNDGIDVLLRFFF